MTELKPWYRSKTVWGSLVAIGAAVGSIVGIDIDRELQVSLADAALQFVTAAGALVALFGRLTATSLIE